MTDMKRLLFVLLLICFCWPASCAWASSPHYVNGILGLKAATMPPPGKVYYRMYNVYYSADSIRDDNGDKVDVDHFRLGAYMLINSFTFASEKTFLGARVICDIDIPFVNVNYSVANTFGQRLPDFMGFHDFTLSKSGASFGLSDVVVNPVILAWSGSWYDLYAGLSFFLPTGRFSKGDPSSPGKGFWTFMPGVGATVYFDKKKTWSASILAHYEIHSEQKETGTTPGNHFHFEWGIGKDFKDWTIGLSGYASWQVTDDKGQNASNKRTTAFAIGPEIDFIIPSMKSIVTLRSLWEFGNHNNAQGNMTVASITFGLGK